MDEPLLTHFDGKSSNSQVLPLGEVHLHFVALSSSQVCLVVGMLGFCRCHSTTPSRCGQQEVTFRSDWSGLTLLP